MPSDSSCSLKRHRMGENHKQNCGAQQRLADSESHVRLDGRPRENGAICGDALRTKRPHVTYFPTERSDVGFMIGLKNA